MIHDLDGARQGKHVGGQYLQDWVLIFILRLGRIGDHEMSGVAFGVGTRFQKGLKRIAL